MQMRMALVGMPDDRRQLGAIARLKPFQGVSLPALIIPPFPMEGGYQRQKRVLVLPEGSQAGRGLDTDRSRSLVMPGTHLRRMETIQNGRWPRLLNMVAGPWLSGCLSENKGDRPSLLIRLAGVGFEVNELRAHAQFCARPSCKAPEESKRVCPKFGRTNRATPPIREPY